MFEKPEDYAAFMRVVAETWEIVPLPIYAIVAMSNHWHFVVRPETSDQVSEFFRRLTVMHTIRWKCRSSWSRNYDSIKGTAEEREVTAFCPLAIPVGWT